jgi:D-alanyl-D-alanine carboxypeptidase/D-alanyl-D-alanine-endopeptidase (penicillin-binding protein 4)
MGYPGDGKACGFKRRAWRGRHFVVLAGVFLARIDLIEAQETGHAPARETLSRQVEAVLKAPGFERGHWGVLVVDAKSGQTVYERNADELFAPASVTKLFTAASALVELGPNFRFGTPIVRSGEVDAKGTLRGDLILVAQGDLSMGGRTGPDGKLVFMDDDHTYAGGNLSSQVTPTDPLAGLDHLAREVKAAGIHEVSGDVLIDDRLFAHASSTGSGPRHVSPIVINDNVMDVVAEPARSAGEPAPVTLSPVTQYATVDAQVATVEAGKSPSLVVTAVGPRRFSVRGRLPLGHARVVKTYEVDDAASFARCLLIESLRRRGVRVVASPLGEHSESSLPSRDQVAKLHKVAEYTSPPFGEYTRVILKVSHNLHASTLPLLLAARHGERTLSAGLAREGEILRRLGVEPGTVSFGGGAGGDRADLATPRATVTLLRAMAARPEFAAYDAALPILGRDGTLAKAVTSDSPARGHAHAKTGTYFVENALEGKIVLTSKALAGYLETASGRSLVFAAFVNNVALDAPRPNRPISDATAAAGRVLGRLCEVLYSDGVADSNGSTPSSARTAPAPPGETKATGSAGSASSPSSAPGTRF